MVSKHTRRVILGLCLLGGALFVALTFYSPRSPPALPRVPPPATLAEAVRQGNVPALEQLLRDGANPNQADASGRTPLFEAALKGEHIAKLLIDHGANLEVVERNGNRPLHFGIRSGNGYFVELLISEAADVNVVDGRGYTPLQLAIRGSLPRVASALIDAGADVNGTGGVGESPLQMARALSEITIEADLRDNGARTPDVP